MLEKIVVKRLLDQFDYELELSRGPEDRIRFLSGPNGYGKTCLFRIIDGLYHGRYDELFSFPFLSLEMWVDGAYLSIEKDEVEVDTDESSDSESESEVDAIRFKYISGEKTFERTLKQGDSLAKFDAPFAVHLHSLRCYFIPDKVIVPQFDVEHIVPDNLFGMDEDIVATSVEECSAGIAEQLNANIIILPNISTEEAGEPISEEEYHQRIAALEETIQKLQEYSLIDGTKISPYKPEFALYLRAYVTKLEDSIGKVNNFLKRVELFDTIIKELEFTNKEMLINSYSGFFFRLTMPGWKFIENEKLSSGEQHVIVQLYNMLFNKAGDYLLTLIDEPELSLHPAWIMLYYKHLAQIVELRNMQCILATHSADIFNMQWDKCIDLYELANEQVNGGKFKETYD